MCYSATVAQNIKDLARQFSAILDYSEVERLLMEWLAGHSIRIPRGFEWNFVDPQTPQERKIKDLDIQYREKKVAELEHGNLQAEEAACRCRAQTEGEGDEISPQ